MSCSTGDDHHLIPVYARYPVVMERGEGCHVFDVDGRRYLDMMAGLGVNALGHGHPRMMAAMVEQAARIVHVSPQFSNPWPGKLAERLCELAGMAGVFFSTGGSEAVEGALKLARTHGRQRGGAQKHELVALRGVVSWAHVRIAVRDWTGQVFNRLWAGAGRACGLWTGTMRPG